MIEAGRVYVHFGSYGTACLDTETGKHALEAARLEVRPSEGAGSSPILYGDLLIFTFDGCDVQYVIALDKTTGKTVWKTDRSIDFGPFDRNIRKAFCTPIVIDAGGILQLISPSAKGLMAYDPATGQELWKIRYNGWSLTPRPLFGHGLLYFINDYEKPELVAVRPEGQGELGDGNVAWKITKGMPSRPSPLLIDDLLFIVNSDGVGSCVDAKTGETIWKNRVSGNFSASPVYADGRIYLCDEGSVTTVIEPAREYKPMSVNKLADEEMFASPAVAGSALFLRRRIICIASKSKTERCVKTGSRPSKSWAPVVRMRKAQLFGVQQQPGRHSQRLTVGVQIVSQRGVADRR